MMFSILSVRLHSLESQLEGCGSSIYETMRMNASAKYDIPENGLICIKGTYLIASLSNYTVTVAFPADDLSYGEPETFDNPFQVNIKVNFQQLYQAEEELLMPISKVECKDKSKSCRVQIVPIFMSVDAQADMKEGGMNMKYNFVSSSTFSTKSQFTMEIPIKFKASLDINAATREMTASMDANMQQLYIMGNTKKKVTITFPETDYTFPITADSNAVKVHQQ